MASLHVPHHAARVVVEMAAVGALEGRLAVHDLVAVDQLGAGVGVRAVGTPVDATLAAFQLHRPEIIQSSLNAVHSQFTPPDSTRLDWTIASSSHVATVGALEARATLPPPRISPNYFSMQFGGSPMS